ncbi:LysM domain-containing protein [Phanerochaete sordida]|uniref:LysM domain-containing protein n=1 Tax=Phanerochaete sordida TaxID=48140 RepID=A0A9P3GPL6_9APHY|nr:LysM domain-containing protein [Phanerochaete sordida]
MFATATLAAFAALLLTVRAQIPADCARTATVQSGDTCNGISAAQNVSTFQLAHVNPGIDAACDNLQVGETLCLGITGQDCTTVHVVQSGDFCAAIAATAGIPLATLLHNNPNVNSGCTNLGIGEVLCTTSETINYS